MRPLDNEVYRGIDEDVMRMAADRGTAIHNAVENYVIYGIEDIEPKHRGYFDAFLRFWAENNPEPLATEEPVIPQDFEVCRNSGFTVCDRRKKSFD